VTNVPWWHLLFISSAYSGGARGLRLARAGNRTTVREVWHNPLIQVHFGSARAIPGARSDASERR
jgi:hypothetical protein